MSRVKFTLSRRQFYLGLFILLTILFFMVPYSHDEWAWGTQTRIGAFKAFFRGYNGRYFGDLISLVITRSVLAKALFMSLTMTALVQSCEHLLHVLLPQADRMRGLIASLLFMIPTTLFAQTYGWPAAFVNFVPPAVFLVWIFSYYLELAKRDLPAGRQVLLGVCLTLGTQFFAENVSIYMVLLAGGMLIYTKAVRKHIAPWHWSVLATSVVGAIIMFVNPAYSNAAENTDGYKHITFGVKYFLQKISNSLIPNIFTGYVVLLVALTAMLCMLLWQQRPKLNVISAIALWFLIAYPLYAVFFYGKMQFGSSMINGLLLTLFTGFYYLALLVIINQTLTADRLKIAWTSLLSIAGLSGPLLMADPIGPRSFFTVFVCWVVLVLAVLSQLLMTQPTAVFSLRWLGNGLLASLLLFYMLTFAYSYYGQLSRTKLIDHAVRTHQSVIELPELPNTRFVWKTSTNEPTWNARFKNFYHIPQNIKVVFPDSPDYSLYQNQIEKSK